jgi:hypothetical protein
MLKEFEHGVLLVVVILSKVGKFSVWEFLPESVFTIFQVDLILSLEFASNWS